MSETSETSPNNQLPELKTFILEARPHSNSWFEVGPIQVYLRKSRRLFFGGYQTTIDIANVSITNPELQQRFSKLVSEIERTAREAEVDFLFLENVLEPRLRDWALNNQWQRDHNSPDILPCFVKGLRTKPPSTEGDIA